MPGARGDGMVVGRPLEAVARLCQQRGPSNGVSTGTVGLRPVVAVTHLFPSTDAEHRGPWVVEQVDAIATSTEIRVLCCSQTARDRTEIRPSGVHVTFRSTRTILGGGRAGLLGSSLRYDRALGAYLRANPMLGLLHAHFGIPDAILVRRQAARAGLPYVVTLHGDDAFKVLPRHDPIGGAVSSVVDVSPVVIPNGYDDALFRLSEQPRDLGLLFVGNLVPTKNIEMLLRAYARERAVIALPLTIVGDGPLRVALAGLAATLGITDDVRFVGVQGRREVARLMARATAL